MRGMTNALWQETRQVMPRMDPYRSYLGNNRNNVCGYRYYCQGNEAIYVWSHGIDGRDGTEDDIGDRPSVYCPLPPVPPSTDWSCPE